MKFHSHRRESRRSQIIVLMQEIVDLVPEIKILVEEVAVIRR
jgi:hypothetical protein